MGGYTTIRVGYILATDLVECGRGIRYREKFVEVVVLSIGHPSCQLSASSFHFLETSFSYSFIGLGLLPSTAWFSFCGNSCRGDEDMDPPRGSKRVRRSDDLFFEEPVQGNGGVYLKVRLSSGKSLKSKGWPWVQLGVRGVIGGSEKVEKASFLSDGSLLLKTKNKLQTEKFLNAHSFANEECEVIQDERLNSSKGTIHAYDLIDLSEDEVVGWLGEFGVVGAKRFTRKTNGKVENTPTILLTFNKPSCPGKLQLDYVTYHVSTYIPNPMMCYRCGRYGHPEARCRNEPMCLQCGKGKHEGECTRWCTNCKKAGHSCLSRECEVWVKEKEICRIKVEQELSYVQARRQYESSHVPTPPVLKGYAAVARTPSAASKQDDEMKDKVGRLEKQMGEMIELLKITH